MKIITDKNRLIDYNNSCFGLKSSTFILTRFNLKLYSKNKANNSVETIEWLQNRFELFESYCFPSVANQNDKNFIWLCCFDEGTPPAYLARIFQYRQNCVNFFPLFFDTEETKKHIDLLLEVIKDLKDDSTLLTTIRLDNDDAISYNFVHQLYLIRKKQYKDSVIYSFTFGLQYFVDYKIATKIKYVDNHFLALTTKNYNLESTDKIILSFRHDKIEMFPYTFICMDDYLPMWVEVIHSSNVANDIKKNLCNGILLDSTVLERHFNFPPSPSKSFNNTIRIHIQTCAPLSVMVWT